MYEKINIGSDNGMKSNVNDNHKPSSVPMVTSLTDTLAGIAVGRG